MQTLLRTPQIAAFPWSALDAVDPRAEASLWTARRWLERAVAPERFAQTLSSLLKVEVGVYRGAVRSSASGSFLELGFQVHGLGSTGVVGFEPALAATLLSTLLRRPIPPLAPDAALDASTQGALSALIVEAARATQASHVLRPCAPRRESAQVAVHFTVVVAGKPYAAVLWVTPELREAPKPSASAEAELNALGSLELELQLVVALGLTTPRALVGLTRGAAFCAGADTWIDARAQGRGILAAAMSERGAAVELGPEGRIVLLEPSRLALANAQETSKTRMETDDASGPPTLAQAVLDAPVVMRVELGSVSMAAREWAALRPGDVLQTGRRIAEPVLLRAGGRVVARGELVNVEGELGVRVLELVGESG